MVTNTDIYSPSRIDTHEQPHDTLATPLQPSEELREVGEAHSTLAASLNVMDYYHGTVTPEQQELIDTIVIDDAQNLAANILPTSVVKELDIPAKRHDDIGFEHPPMLSDLFLLVRAYDATRDETLQQSIEYILDQVPPNLSELLAEGYRRSLDNDTTIMDEYKHLSTIVDSELDFAHTIPLADTDHNGFVKYKDGYVSAHPQTDRTTDPFVDELLDNYLTQQSKQTPADGNIY